MLVVEELVKYYRTMQAAAATIYPNWEDPTQQYMGGLLGMVAGMVALGPPAVVGVLGWYLKIGVVATALAMTLVSGAISTAGIALSGYLYKRYDPRMSAPRMNSGAI